MQLDFSCKRYLQNPKFLVWTITSVKNFTIYFIKLQLPFVGASLDKNNYTFKKPCYCSNYVLVIHSQL
jgi:hypothetical protein